MLLVMSSTVHIEVGRKRKAKAMKSLDCCIRSDLHKAKVSGEHISLTLDKPYSVLISTYLLSKKAVIKMLITL